MFFKSNDNRPEETPALFSMERIGRQLMRARKKKGMTQMELADRMGISFQAVSNWERGLSCPDIARLFELSELFDVSIDELLGNPRAAQIATEVMDGAPPALPVEELAEVAPLLDQKQADEIMQKSLIGQEREEGSPAAEQPQKSLQEHMEDILPLLPYASEKTIAELARAALLETHGASLLGPLLIHMDESDVNALAKEVFRETQDAEQLKPFLIHMDESDVGALAKEVFQASRDAGQITPFLIYMDESDVSALAKEVLRETQDLKQIEPFLTYMDEDDIDALLRSLLSK